MENNGQVGLSSAAFSIIVILLGVIASAKAENKSDPLANVNLSPFWQWRSAYECLLNGESGSGSICSEMQVLKLDGVISVNQSQVSDYCKKGGCAQHTVSVLNCIHDVKRNFWFANKATVKYINDTLATQCSSSSSTGFTTADYTSNAITNYPVISVMAMAAFITTLFFMT